MLPLLLIPITFTVEVLQISELSISIILGVLPGKFDGSFGLVPSFSWTFSYARGGNIPHILMHLAGKKAVFLEADGLGICLAQSF